MAFSVNEQAIVILGNQKSGTSAIAGLLAERTGKSVTIDTPVLWDPFLSKLLDNELEIKSWINKNPQPFSKDIIKEPNLTFFASSLFEVFTQGKFLFIVRDPRSNIRSLLNRMNLPGDSIQNPDFQEIPSLWKPIFARHPSTMHYIDVLCDRWNSCVNAYLENEKRYTLIRYEDFVQDKLGEIDRIAELLNLPVNNDISEKLDKQYQPKGDSSVALIEFFGKDNLNKIHQKCGSLMDRLAYKMD